MIELKIKNFNIGQIGRSGQCFRMTEREDGWCSVIAGDHYVDIMQHLDQVTFHCSQSEFDSFWKEYFDLNRDYRAIQKQISEDDAYLLSASEYGSGIRILKQDLWEMLVSFLISQNNNIARIRKCIDNLCIAYGGSCINSRGEMYYAFPKVETLAGLNDDDLKPCNLGYRSKYVVRTAKMIQSGDVSLERIKELPYEDAKEELLKCYGVGSKVADCICLFGLHHLDAFPIDTHIKKVLDRYYPAGFPFERYKGISGVLQQYIFYYDLF